MPLLPTLTSLAHVAAGLLGELVAPTRCAACDEGVRPTALFCVACAGSVERVERSSVRGHAAAFDYGGAIATAIAKMKYAGRADLGPRLGAAMAARAGHLAGAVEVVVPVPLHAKRLAERGFNQSALLARPVARRLAIPLLPRALFRVRDTPRQASLDRRARMTNTAGAFALRPGSLPEGSRVLLVDDVRTTGATLEACAEALARGGARQVVALVLATRTDRHPPGPRADRVARGL